MSRKQRRTVVRKEVVVLFVPLAKFIVLKVAQLEAREATSAAHDKLLEELKSCKNKKRTDESVVELEQVQKLLEVQSEFLAFKEKAEQQISYIKVAQYQDEWCNVEGGKLRAWYACLNTGKKRQSAPCGTVIASKRWPRKFDDPSAVRQKWYCACCKVKYATRWGMLVEVVVKGISFSCRSPVTEADVEDVRAMCLES